MDDESGALLCVVIGPLCWMHTHCPDSSQFTLSVRMEIKQILVAGSDDPSMRVFGEPLSGAIDIATWKVYGADQGSVDEVAARHDCDSA